MYECVKAQAYVLEMVSGYLHRVGYTTFEEAYANVDDGETIGLLCDLTLDKDDVVVLDGKYKSFFIIEGKTITFDLNGHHIYANAQGIEEMVVGLFATDNNGHLILNDSKGSGNVTLESNGANVYALIVNYESGCTITINGGNYSLDYASDSLMYTGANEGIIVNGGTFNLGNIGTGKNQSPWMFNAKGQNTAHVIVNGGTFNADVQHQYYPFEVYMKKELALSKNNGIYSVVDAVAYVNEQEFSGKWYTNEVGYATLEEAYAALEGIKISKDGQVSQEEYVTILNKEN